jgi:signal peptidase
LFTLTVAAALGVLAVAAHLVPGWSSTIVASPSMSPALRIGDVVAYGAVGPDRVGVGTVVVFRADDGRRTVHRVAGVEPDGTLTTRGDANPTVDSAPVPPSAVEGRGLVLVPFVGVGRIWWGQQRWAALALLGGGLATAAALARWAGPDGTGGRTEAGPIAWLLADAPAAPGLLGAGGAAVVARARGAR